MAKYTLYVTSSYIIYIAILFMIAIISYKRWRFIKSEYKKLDHASKQKFDEHEK